MMANKFKDKTIYFIKLYNSVCNQIKTAQQIKLKLKQKHNNPIIKTINTMYHTIEINH